MTRQDYTNIADNLIEIIEDCVVEPEVGNELVKRFARKLKDQYDNFSRAKFVKYIRENCHIDLGS